MLTGRTVTVIGAGVGGLTTAIALAQRGAHVRVLEQAAEIGEIGAGLQIAPNGIAVLDSLGLGDGVRATGLQSDRVELRDYRRGAPVAGLDTAPAGGGRPYLLLHRADLIDLLAGAAHGAGVRIQHGKTVTDVTSTPKGTTISFADKTRETAALLVGADGLRSLLRARLNGAANPFFTGQVAWRAVVAGADSSGVSIHMGPGRHVVSYPLRGGSLTNIVAVLERRDWAREGWDHPGEATDLHREFAMFCPQVRKLLAQVTSPHIWGLFRHPVARHWHGHRCALVGDAAHPMLPFLAQGASMAIEDAWVLADCLANLPDNAALSTYQQRRQGRVTRVVAAANANARNYHIRNPVMRLAAHSALRVASRVTPKALIRQFDWLYQHDVTTA